MKSRSLSPRFQCVDRDLPTIPELTARLKAPDGSVQEGHLVVQGDRATDFGLVRQVIGSVNAAGWTHIEFAVVPVLAVSR